MDSHRIRHDGNPVLLGILEDLRSAKKSWSLSALSVFQGRLILLQITGDPRKALQYEIGNPLTALRMTQHQLAAALYAPLRVVLYENAAGQSVFEYDRPSSPFG